MLDLARLDRIRLSPRPFAQRFVGRTFLSPNYEWTHRVQIELEGAQSLPDEPVIFAMNHTDRFNYWPFQYALWRRHDRFTATWVKGKYYETRAVGMFMELTNNIPTVSRGYLITRDFMATLGRRPRDDEYAALRRWVDDGVAPGPDSVEARLLEEPRDILGRAFNPERESYADAIGALFDRMMRRFVELNEEAASAGLDLLVFPQGTRSIRLSRGRVGLAQIAMHLGRAVVPVGCNGSDKIYPGSSPVAGRGRVVYRFGEPLRRADAPAWIARERFVPFSRQAEREHGDDFQRYVDEVMARIDRLLDPEYRFAPDGESGGVRGSERFV